MFQPSLVSHLSHAGDNNKAEQRQNRRTLNTSPVTEATAQENPDGIIITVVMTTAVVESPSTAAVKTEAAPAAAGAAPWRS